ncbi:hypothetical protein RFI_34908, partial [Reticulomyxa filosa]
MPFIGEVFVGGLTVDYPFLKDLITNKLEMGIEVCRRSNFKTAANMLQNDSFDKFHRKQYQDLIQQMETNFFFQIAKDRKIKPFP